MKDIHYHIMEPYALVPARDYAPPTLENAHYLADSLDLFGLEQACIPAISLYEPEDFPCNPLALYAKTLSPDRIYALAGLRYGLSEGDNADLLQQAEMLWAAGFDGFKMICKPNARRKLRVPIDHPMFDPFFARAEQEQWPILYHVGDPSTFWDPVQAPDWAKASGWYYGGEAGLPTYEQLYEEVDRMLEKHPRLRVTFAHFFFCSENFERLERMFARYPNMRIDVTPGREMYEDFSAKPDETRAFFAKHRERILLGTDNRGANGEECAAVQRSGLAKLDRLRRFYQTTDTVFWGDTPVRGMGFDAGLVHCLFDENFSAFLHRQPPRPVDPKALLALCRLLAPTASSAAPEYREALARFYQELEAALAG